MNLDELRPILQGYREQVAPAWSPATAYNGDGEQGSPRNQCGVTSAWLQRRLAEDHGVETVYCYGTVISTRTFRAVDHCWLEIGDATKALILDLTGTQIPTLTWRVVCMDYVALYERGFDYNLSERFAFEQLAADPVQARLAVLEAAMS